MDTEKATSPNTGLQQGHGPTIHSGPDTFRPRPPHRCAAATRSLRPAQQRGSRPQGELQEEAGAVRVPSSLPQPWSRRGAAVTSVEYSGSAFVPVAVFLRAGARQRVPRRGSPPPLAVALGGPGPAAFQASQRRAPGSPGWRPRSSRMKPSARCTPAPAMAAAKRQHRSLPYTVHLWFADQDPFKAEGYDVP